MIEVRSMLKYFNRASVNEVLALDELNLDVSPGDFITIIGSNGAGKSTFLNCLAGTYSLDGGQIIYKQKDVSSWPEYKRAAFIGRVFQDPLLGTCSQGSIAQNMALAFKRGRIRGLGRGVKPKDRKLFKEKLLPVGLGLENRLDDKVGLLSGGQRQALTMVMATLVQPDLLLLDEHTAALDPKTARQILDLTLKIVESHSLTTLMVTHNMTQAISMGNRLIMLHRGKVILDMKGREKAALSVEDLLSRFYEVQKDGELSDRMLLV